jgi:hypothetical protein
MGKCDWAGVIPAAKRERRSGSGRADLAEDARSDEYVGGGPPLNCPRKRTAKRSQFGHDVRGGTCQLLPECKYLGTCWNEKRALC